MSGSYDRYSGRPPAPVGPYGQGQGQSPVQTIPAGRNDQPTLDPMTGPVTAPPTQNARVPAAFGPGPDAAAGLDTTTEDYGASEMYAPAREKKDKGRKNRTAGPVVPPGSVTGRSLTLVIAIMCFLACLTAGAVWMIKQSADAWLKDIASEVTVQVEPREKTDVEKSVLEVVTFIERQKGIVAAKPLSLEDSAGLLEPWLGSTEALKALPVPRLIAIEIDRADPPDLSEIGAALQRDFKGVSLDDHRRWQQQIRAVTGSFALGGVAIFLLVAAATTAVIVSATKSSMASNKDIVEVLHFVGATDKFIAREFERHFLRLGIKAGIVGALAAMAVFLTMPAIMDLLGGGAVSAVEMQRLIGTGSLDAAGYVLLGLVVVIIAGLCMITSRVGVYRILNSQH